MITIDEFQKMEIRIATIEHAERVHGADKLVRLQIDLGDEKRQLVAGIGHRFTPEELIGKQIPVLANLEPKLLRGVESKGMMLAAGDGNDVTLITPEKGVPPGTKVR